MLGAPQPHTACPVPLACSLYTLRQCSAAVRVALGEYEAGRASHEEAVRAAYDALIEERRALLYQLRVRELHARVERRDWPAGMGRSVEQVAVLGRLVMENFRLGRRLERVLAGEAVLQ